MQRPGTSHGNQSVACLGRRPTSVIKDKSPFPTLRLYLAPGGKTSSTQCDMKWRSAWHDACSPDRANGNTAERSSCRDLRTLRRTTRLPTRGNHAQPNTRPDPRVRLRRTHDPAVANRHGAGPDQQLTRIPRTGAQHRDHHRGSDPSRSAAASADQRRGLPAILEPDSHRCERRRPHAACSPATGARDLRRAAWPRPLRAAPSPSCTSRFSTRSTRSSAAIAATRPAAHVRHDFDRRGHRTRRARHAGGHVPVAETRASTRCWREDLTAHPAPGPAHQGARHRPRAGSRPRLILARRANDGGVQAEPRMVGDAASPSGDARASGARTRSARSRSRSARTGATVEPFVLRSADQFRAPPPPAIDQRGVRRRRTTR